MKPIVIKVNEDGRVFMSPDEIQKMVDDAYQTGYEDGRKSINITCPSPSWPSNDPNRVWDPVWKITCDKHPGGEDCGGE